MYALSQTARLKKIGHFFCNPSLSTSVVINRVSVSFINMYLVFFCLKSLLFLGFFDIKIVT